MDGTAKLAGSVSRWRCSRGEHYGSVWHARRGRNNMFHTHTALTPACHLQTDVHLCSSSASLGRLATALETPSRAASPLRIFVPKPQSVAGLRPTPLQFCPRQVVGIRCCDSVAADKDTHPSRIDRCAGLHCPRPRIRNPLQERGRRRLKNGPSALGQSERLTCRCHKKHQGT